MSPVEVFCSTGIVFLKGRWLTCLLVWRALPLQILPSPELPLVFCLGARSRYLPGTWGSWVSGHWGWWTAVTFVKFSVHRQHTVGAHTIFLAFSLSQFIKLYLINVPSPGGGGISSLWAECLLSSHPCCQLLESRCFILLLSIKDFNFSLPRVRKRNRRVSQILQL